MKIVAVRIIKISMLMYIYKHIQLFFMNTNSVNENRSFIKSIKLFFITQLENLQIYFYLLKRGTTKEKLGAVKRFQNLIFFLVLPLSLIVFGIAAYVAVNSDFAFKANASIVFWIMTMFLAFNTMVFFMLKSLLVIDWLYSLKALIGNTKIAKLIFILGLFTGLIALTVYFAMIVLSNPFVHIEGLVHRTDFLFAGLTGFGLLVSGMYLRHDSLKYGKAETAK